MSKIDFKKEKIPFTQIANEVLTNPELTAKAKGLYAYLYSKPEGWNFAIDRIAKDFADGRRSINTGLQELENQGYLIRERQSDGRVSYILKSQMSKTDIGLQKPHVQNSKVLKQQSAEMDTVSNTDSKVIKSISNKEYSPKQINQNFFEQGQVYEALLNEFSQRNDREMLEREFKKFWLYWTELNKSGKKQRWEMQPTFQVKRRLATWLLNVKGFSTTGITKSSGIKL